MRVFVPLLLLLSLSLTMVCSSYHPGQEFMVNLTQHDAELADTFRGILDRASVHHSLSASEKLQQRVTLDKLLHRKRQSAFASGTGVPANAPPIVYSPNIDPNPFVIPPGAATIKLGRTWPQTDGNPETLSNRGAEQGFRTFERIINTNGGILLNGTTRYVDWISYNDGADCNLMIILYERLIVVDKVVALFTPVHFQCSIVALVAEAYQIPLINTCDYTLPILMDSVPAYQNLKWTWDVTANPSTAGETCVKPAYEAGARSFASFEVPEIPFYAGQAEAAARALNMTISINMTTLSIQDALASYNKPGATDNCTYMNIYIDKLIAAKPDMLYGSMLTQTDTMLDCMYRRLYYPKLLFITAGQSTDPAVAWRSVGRVGMDLWPDHGSYTDPYLGSINSYTDLFNQMWNVSGAGWGYQATHSVGGSLALYAISATQSFDPVKLAAVLSSLNITTLIGQTYLIPGTRHYFHPYYCQQFYDENSTVVKVVYPSSFPGVVSVQYPWNFTYPKAFLDSLVKPTFTTTQLILIIVLTVVLGSLLVGGLIGLIVWLVVRSRYHTVFIPKAGNNPEWGSADGK
jgi:hypothetical protein